MSNSAVEEIPLKIVICDADTAAAVTLDQSLRKADGILAVKTVHSVADAEFALKAETFNTIFIDPLSVGLEPATTFVLGIRQSLPEIVFVLYFNKAAAEHQRGEFYRGERRRFSHYYELDKQTPTASFGDELATVVRICRDDLSWRMSAASLQRLKEEATRMARSTPSSEDALAQRVEELLARLAPRFENKSGALTKSRRVFLSHRFAEKEYVGGLTQLLEQSGFEVVTGQATNTYISKAVIERIRDCEYFLCLMTQDAKKVDGTFTTSPWLLEEKGVALAIGKPIVLMVEEGVTDFGGLQGDWQRIHFGQKGFLSAALQAVEQLKSYGGGSAV